MSVRIGSDSITDDLPQAIEIRGQKYILSRNNDDDLVIFSSECPHRGGTVELTDEECLRCPRHRWEFDSETGKATHAPTESLPQYEVYERDGHLHANIPQSETAVEFDVPNQESNRPRISVLSHATLSIEYNGFNLLTDPWLDGPAFFGAWTQYPPPTCDVDTVASETDAMWITHEHADHLHPQTLAHFPSETPIYVPELNYQRLATRLQELGFENVHSLPTDVPYQLTDDVEAICFESNSTWNDSILAVNCGGFKIINFNDAGINWKVNRAIPDADLVASGFATGATSYPIRWNHLDIEEKKRLIEERNNQELRMCEQLVEMFDADYLLPFAKFFELVQPEHKPYRELLEQNRPSDVTECITGHDVTVLDLLPGERWDGQNESINRRADREQYFETSFKERYLQNAFESQEPATGEKFDLTHEELATYFETLSGSTLASKIDNLAVTLSLTGDENDLAALIRIRGGEIEYRPTEKPTPIGEVDADNHLSISGLGKLVQHVVRNDLSWDVLQIGYWFEFDRQPDEHNLHFWHLLHAPWEARDDMMRVAEGYDINTELAGTTIADLVEQENVENILSAYGLHCAGCPQGIGEDVIEAARIHGLNPDQARQLVDELESTVSDKNIAGD